MPTAIIKSTVLTTTIIGSRDDVSIGNVVSLEHNGVASSYFWEFLSRPPGSAVTFSPNSSNATPTFTPDVVGSYLIRLTIDGDTAGADVRVVAVNTVNLGIRIPAAGETSEYDNNPVTGVDGWHEALYDAFTLLDAQVIRADGTGAVPTAAFSFNNQRATSLGAPVSSTDALRKVDVTGISNLNSTVGVTLDTSSDTRTPISHSLGNSFHTAITLAELNALVSDANLDDEGDSRSILAHGLGDSYHTSTTLAALNALISDATLDDVGDPRSVSAHTLGGVDHLPSTLSELNSLVSDANLADEADISLDYVYERGGTINLDIGPVFLAGVNGSTLLHDGYIRLEEGNDPSTLDNYGAIYTKEASGITELFYKDSAGNVRQLTPSSGNTLDQAYDQGGAGAGRVINASAGAVRILAPNPSSVALELKGSAIDGYLSKIHMTAEGDDSAAVGIVVDSGDPSRVDLHGIYVDSYGQLQTAGGKRQGVTSKITSDASDSSTAEWIAFYGLAEGPQTASKIGVSLGDNFDTAIKALSGDIVVESGYVSLGEISDPASATNRGRVYTKDISGITELFFMDSAGTVTQITDDGYLDTFNSLRGVGLWEQSGDPTPVAGKAHLYTKDVSGNTEFFFQDSDSNVVQITDAGVVVGSVDLDAYAPKSLLDSYATSDVVDGYALTSGLSVYAEKTLLDSYATSDVVDGYALSSDLDVYAEKTLLDSYATSTELVDYAEKTLLDSYATPDVVDGYALTSSLSVYAEKTLLDSYATSDVVDGYALTSDLSTYAEKVLLDSYATNAELADYAEKSLLDSYATPNVVDGYALDSDLDVYAEKTLLDSYATPDVVDGYALASDLSTYAEKALLDSYATNSDLGDYALKTLLDSYTTADVVDGYALSSDLDVYAEKTLLDSYALAGETGGVSYADIDDYAKKELLDSYLSSAVLDGYVSEEALEDYALKTLLDSYATPDVVDGYALSSDLDVYAEKTLLDSYALAGETGGLNYADIDDYAKKDLLDSYLSSAVLDGYVSQEALEDYAEKTLLDSYATPDVVDGYALSSDLNVYAEKVLLDSYATPDVVDGYALASDLEVYAEKTLLDSYLSSATLDGYALESDIVGLPEQSSDPAAYDNYGTLYSKDVDGYTELFFLDNYGNAVQVSDRGDINLPTGSGEANLGTNVGTGAGEVFRNKTGVTLNFKRLQAGSNINLTNNADEIVIASTAAGGGGSDLIDGYLPLAEQLSDPNPIDDYGIVYTKDVDGYKELFFLDAYGNSTQVTNAGNVNTQASAFSLTNSATGLLTGGEISVNGGDNTKFDIAAGKGYVIDGYSDPENPTIVEVSWNDFTALDPVGLGSSFCSFVAIDETGSVLQQTSFFTPDQLRCCIVLGQAVHFGGSIIDDAIMRPVPVFDRPLTAADLATSIGAINRSGNIYSANGSNLNLNKSSGETYRLGTNYENSKENPSISLDSLGTALSFRYIYRDGSGGFTSSASINSVVPGSYDDGDGTLGSVNSNHWTIQRIYYCGPLNNTFIHYGQTTYNSMSRAEAAILGEVVELDPKVQAETTLRAWLVVRGGATDLSSSGDAKFISAGKFGGSPATGINFATTDLQQAYNNSPEPEIVLNSTQGALSLQDAATPLGTNLFEISSNGKTQDYFSIDAEKTSVDGYLTLSELASNPLEIPNQGSVYTREIDGYTELFYLDDYGLATQITNKGAALGSGTGGVSFADIDDYAKKTLLDGYATPDVVDGYALYSDLDLYAEKTLLDSYLTTGDLTDGYIGFSVDELDPDSTDGTETALELTFEPAEPNALSVYRNGALMRRVASLDDDYQEYTLSGSTVSFLATNETGEWYSSQYIDSYNLVGAADGYSGTVEVSPTITFVISNGLITNVIE